FPSFFLHTAPAQLYTLSLHDALPIFPRELAGEILHLAVRLAEGRGHDVETVLDRPVVRVGIARGDPERRVRLLQRLGDRRGAREDRKSTRLNSSHVKISYAVFCLKKK